VTRVVPITVERPTRDPLHQNATTELSSQAQLERHTISAAEHGWMCPDPHCTAPDDHFATGYTPERVPR